MKKAGAFDASLGSVSVWTQGFVRNLVRKRCGCPHPSNLSATLEARARGRIRQEEEYSRAKEAGASLCLLKPVDSSTPALAFNGISAGRTASE